MADMHWTSPVDVGARQAFDVAHGPWWRFDRYEVREGCVRPAPGARLEQYDPWDQYRAARDGDTRVDPPYAALVALVGVLADDPETVVDGDAVRLGPSGEANLVRWCADYGLVGMLPHQTVLASLAPRWETALGSGDQLMVVRGVHRWDAYGWAATTKAWWRPDLRPLAEAARSGDLVPADLYAGQWPEPQALMHMIRDGRWATLRLGEA